MTFEHFRFLSHRLRLSFALTEHFFSLSATVPRTRSRTFVRFLRSSVVSVHEVHDDSVSISGVIVADVIVCSTDSGPEDDIHRIRYTTIDVYDVMLDHFLRIIIITIQTKQHIVISVVATAPK